MFMFSQIDLSAYCRQKAKKETREAPTKDPRTGKVEDAALEAGPGAAAGASVEAMTALIEAAATMTAQEIFFMSMVQKNKLTERPALFGDENFIL